MAIKLRGKMVLPPPTTHHYLCLPLSFPSRTSLLPKNSQDPTTTFPLSVSFLSSFSLCPSGETQSQKPKPKPVLVSCQISAVGSKQNQFLYFDVPGSALGSACPFCGKLEIHGHVVGYDGCEYGFHLTCTEMHGRQAMNLKEWVCKECTCSAVRSKRWPLGVKSK